VNCAQRLAWRGNDGGDQSVISLSRNTRLSCGLVTLGIAYKQNRARGVTTLRASLCFHCSLWHLACTLASSSLFAARHRHATAVTSVMYVARKSHRGNPRHLLHMRITHARALLPLCLAHARHSSAYARVMAGALPRPPHHSSCDATHSKQISWAYFFHTRTHDDAHLAWANPVRRYTRKSTEVNKLVMTVINLRGSDSICLTCCKQCMRSRLRAARTSTHTRSNHRRCCLQAR